MGYSHMGLQRVGYNLATKPPPLSFLWTSQLALVVKNPPANAGDARDMGSIPGSGRSPGEGHGNSIQYSCLENHHGQSSLAGDSPWASKESDTTERQSTAQSVKKQVRSRK